MNRMLLSLSMMTLNYFCLIETSALNLKPKIKEAAALRNIECILNQFGRSDCEKNTFWELPAMREMRSSHKHGVSDITINTGRFAQAIHDIRAILHSNKSRRTTISQEFYTVLLCEIVDRRLNGRPHTPRVFFSEESSPRNDEWSGKQPCTKPSPIADTNDSCYNDDASELSSFIID